MNDKIMLYFLSFHYQFIFIPIMNTMSCSWFDVRKHQNNSSTSKAAYAFPKENRFRSSSKALCDSFYNIPSNLGKSQASGIGRGNKISLHRNTNAPSPSKYYIKSAFQQKIIGGKIGIGRQNTKYGGIFQEKQTPQPGRYNVGGDLSSSRSKFTMRTRTKLNQDSNTKNPGPGQYSSLSTLNATGRYIVSGVKNCPSSRIVQGKAYDADKHKNVPGPGTYNSKQNLNASGKYFNSKFGSSRCRVFSKSIKKNDFVPVSKVPGPGSYNCFSQFGARIR